MPYSYHKIKNKETGNIFYVAKHTVSGLYYSLIHSTRGRDSNDDIKLTNLTRYGIGNNSCGEELNNQLIYDISHALGFERQCFIESTDAMGRKTPCSILFREGQHIFSVDLPESGEPSVPALAVPESAFDFVKN